MSFPKNISLSQIQKLIPKHWKQTTNKQLDLTPYNCPKFILENNTPISNKSMLQYLVASLKDYAKQGHISQAFKTFSLIKSHYNNNNNNNDIKNIESDDIVLHSIYSLIFACTTHKLYSQGKQLHAHVFSMGFEAHPYLVPKLVSFYTSLGYFDDALAMIENFHNGNGVNPLPWNTLISDCVRNGLCSKALSAYTQMVKSGIKPDNFTYPSVLKACGEEFDLGLGREVHKMIDERVESIGWNLFVQNALVAMYGKCGEVSLARDVFDKMYERDEVSWNSMISCYASKGMWKEAFELFDKMRIEGIVSNIIIWNTIAGGCLRKGDFEGALNLLSQMSRNLSFRLDSVAMLNGLGACSHIGVLRLGKEIHGAVIRCSFDDFDNVRNSLITMYARCKDLTHASILFDLVEVKSMITWNSMLSGYAHMDRSEEASFLFREMLLSGIEPNYVTIASILPLCARVANLQHGKEFHCYLMRREGFNDYLLLWNALVDMYARSGKVLEARRVFNSLSKKDEVTYTSLIAGYGMQGEGQAALELFKEMNDFQIKVDHITMVAVLSACSHSGLIKRGQILFEKMQPVYGIIPHLEHYSCMVDLYGRSGLLNKAKEIITRMPFRPTAAMWATLLGACQIHGNTDIGEWAAEKLLEMKPEHAGYYVLIANTYAAAGCWNKLANVRVFMRDLGVKKDPGCAWVDVGSEFFSFTAGDTSSSHAYEYHPMLDSLSKLMKDADYVASEDFSSSEEILEECL